MAGNETGWKEDGCFAAGEGGLRRDRAVLCCPGPALGVHPPLHRSHNPGGFWSSLWDRLGAAKSLSQGIWGTGVLCAEGWASTLGCRAGWVVGVKGCPHCRAALHSHLGVVTPDICCLCVSPLLGPTQGSSQLLPGWCCTRGPLPLVALHPITLCPGWC